MTSPIRERRGSPTEGTQFAVEIPVWLDTSAACPTLQPIRFGLPLPKGTLLDGFGATIRNAFGIELAGQSRVLGRWSDQSVKWLLVDVALPELAPGRSQWRLHLRDGDAAQLAWTDQRQRFVSSEYELKIDTTDLLTSVRRNGGGSLCHFKQCNGEQHTLTAVLTDSKGRMRGAQVENAEVVASGRVCTTIALQGHFPKARGLRFRAEVCIYNGTGLVKMRFTVHNPNRARHRGGLWDLGDPGSFMFQDLSIKLCSFSPPKTLAWQCEQNDKAHEAVDGRLEIYQDSSGGENWKNRNHVNREGRVPCRFRGYQVTTSQGTSSGHRAEPRVTSTSERGSITVAMPEFWQQFPKSLSYQAAEATIGLFPRQWEDLFEMQGGEQKTHTVWFHFGSPVAEEIPVLNWVHQPARVGVAPGWIAHSKAVPWFETASGDVDERLQNYMAEVLNGQQSIVAGRERIDEYGWRNFGDLHADHEEAYCPSPRPVISHYNNQFDVIYGLILHYLRSGDGRYIELFDSLARHVTDIDIYHTTQDRSAYSGGLFWFTDHYLDAATSSHRTYSRANRPTDGQPYGGGPGCEHNFTTGLLHYYYLTGDDQALAAVLELAEWVIRMDDGKNNLLGAVDRSPTGLATRGYAGRGAGNSICALIDAWQVSQQRCFLDKAESLIRQVVHPDDDVAARDLLNVEQFWSYTVFLTALARYLQVKAEAGEFDAAYSYARLSLLKYARWMVDHERPYYDCPEQLEYPTEAWSAQEFRKANVFRLAAEHAEGDSRAALLARGESFADRAWADLLRFETRFTARAVAIVMTEGVKDQYFRAGLAESFSAEDRAVKHGAWEPFVPQRAKVFQQMKSVRGSLRTICRLIDPRSWRGVSLRL